MRAAREVATSEPDGATLFMATLGTHAIAPYLAIDAACDPLRDFTCVSLISRSPMLLACHPSLGVTTVAGLIERARTGELTYATSAIGGAPHLAAELFQQLAGVTMRHVRYDETERLYRDLEAGRVALSFNNIISMLPRFAAERCARWRCPRASVRRLRRTSRRLRSPVSRVTT